jgi:hypothetical protein
MLREDVQQLNRGIEVDGTTLYAKEITAGRFSEEANLVVYGKKAAHEDRLLHVKVYYGREPYYRPWVEISGIRPQIDLGTRIEYFGSIFEDRLLELFSRDLGPGGKIYVEYQADRETLYGLRYGVPPAITRLGSKLFELGFTWFKDWYFPEGGSEGGMKLQGEKPLDETRRERHVRGIRDEVTAYLEKVGDASGDSGDEYERWLARAAERSRSVLEKIDGVVKTGASLG